MLLYYVIAALFISWIWVDYYRLIDVYHSNDFYYFLGSFLLGGLSVLPVLGIGRYVFDPLGISHYNIASDDLFGNIAAVFLGIGLVEELSKLALFGLVLVLFRRQFKEPMDYIAYACTVALGFSAVENVMYFSRYGAGIILDRAVLSTVAHMIDASIMAYGIIRYLYHPKPLKKWSIIYFVLLAAFAHGFYDFWLLYRPVQNFGWVVTLVFFLFMISVFAGILNNAANNSAFFTYKKVINSRLVSIRLLQYYGVIFVMQYLLVAYEDSLGTATIKMGANVFTTGFIILVSTVRLSRFKLIKNRWNRIRFELPFAYATVEDYGGRSVHRRIQVRGDSYNESVITGFYNEYMRIAPLSRRNSSLQVPRLAFMEKKFFLHNDDTYYLVRIYPDDTGQGNGMFMFIKPKIHGKSFTKSNKPIAALLRIDHLENHNDPSLKVSDFKFVEWVVLNPIDEEHKRRLSYLD